MAHHPTHQQSPSTKTEAGKILVTWLKLDMLMVQLPQDLSQWLLVAVADHRKFISKRYYNNFNILSTNTELWDFGSLETQIIDATLSTNSAYGVGLFLVDKNYCSKT